ncbi:ATP-dependent helicase, partial [Streptomyces sp. NRRL S-444]
GLALLDPPPAGAMAAAREVLVAVGAVSPAHRVTPRGQRMARLGLHPRLARALLDGSAALGARRAAELVALLSEEPPREYGDDLAAAWRRARAGGDAYAARWRTEAARLRRAVPEPAGPSPTPPVPAAPLGGSAAGGTGGDSFSDDAAAGLVAALAFPERVAKARSAGAFLMAGGTAAELGDGSPLRSAGWVAVAVADRGPHSASARVRLAAVIDEDTARAAARHLLA